MEHGLCSHNCCWCNDTKVTPKGPCKCADLKIQEASVDDHGTPIPAVMAKVIDNYAPVDVDKYLPKETFRTEFGWALDCEKIGCTVKEHAGWVFPYSFHAVRPDDHPTKLVTRKVTYTPWT